MQKMNRPSTLLCAAMWTFLSSHTLTVNAQILPGSGGATDWADSVCADRDFDFGTVSVAKNPIHKFILQNPTSEVLEVGPIGVGCSCIDARITSRSIEPGESAKLVVTANTKNFRGKKASSVVVKFKNPERELKFVLKMTINPVAVSPAQLVLVKDAGGRSSGKIKVTRAGSAFWKLNRLSTTCKLFSVEISDTNVEPGKVTYELECHFFNPDELPFGSEEHIILHTNDSSTPEMRIPITVREAKQEIELAPASIELSVTKTKSSKSQKILVLTEEPTKIIAIEFDRNLVTASVEIRKVASKTHVLEVGRSEQLKETITEPAKTAVQIKTASGLVADLEVTLRPLGFKEK